MEFRHKDGEKCEDPIMVALVGQLQDEAIHPTVSEVVKKFKNLSPHHQTAKVASIDYDTRDLKTHLKSRIAWGTRLSVPSSVPFVWTTQTKNRAQARPMMHLAGDTLFNKWPVVFVPVNKRCRTVKKDVYDQIWRGASEIAAEEDADAKGEGEQAVEDANTFVPFPHELPVAFFMEVIEQMQLAVLVDVHMGAGNSMQAATFSPTKKGPDEKVHAPSGGANRPPRTPPGPRASGLENGPRPAPRPVCVF